VAAAAEPLAVVSGRFAPESPPPEQAASSIAAAKPSGTRVMERSCTVISSCLGVTNPGGKKPARRHAAVRLESGVPSRKGAGHIAAPALGPGADFAPAPDTRSPRSNDMSGRTPVRTVPKPWGHETIWASNDLYVGKILHVNAGQSLSVQYHNVKDETVYLLNGEMKYWVQVEGSDELQDMRLKTGEAFRITPGTIHYIEAVTDCDVLEASTPHLDDVVRLKDRYGREGTSAP
jgi:mannose-6-phosphate isomerase